VTGSLRNRGEPIGVVDRHDRRHGCRNDTGHEGVERLAVPTSIAPPKHLLDVKRRRRVVVAHLRLYVGNRRAGLQHQCDERAPERARRDRLGQRRLLSGGALLVRKPNRRCGDPPVEVVLVAP
jgi:hypothetical protein